jgi:hypothetical protein
MSMLASDHNVPVSLVMSDDTLVIFVEGSLLSNSYQLTYMVMCRSHWNKNPGVPYEILW